MSFVDMAYLKKVGRVGQHTDLLPPENGTNPLYRMGTTDAGHRRQVRHGKGHKLPSAPHYAGGRHGTYPVRKQDAASKPAFEEIGQQLGLPIPLTTYCARHSWATIARDKNVPLAVISEALGHDNEQTTRIYLDSIRTSVVDDANRMIIEGL